MKQKGRPEGICYAIAAFQTGEARRGILRKRMICAENLLTFRAETSIVQVKQLNKCLIIEERGLCHEETV